MQRPGRMDIEAAIRWAIRDELPKSRDLARHSGPVLATPGWVGRGLLGVRIDDSARLNRYGVVPFEGVDADPHPAAIALMSVVDALDDLVLDFEGWAAFDDWPADGDEARALTEASARGLGRLLSVDTAGAARLAAGVSGILRRSAVLGPPGGWAAERPEWREVSTIDGRRKWFRMVDQPCAWNDDGDAVSWERVEVDGWNARQRRAGADAYTRMALHPDPRPVAEARAEWQIWRAALDVAAEAARGAVFEGEGDTVSLADLGLSVSDSARPWRPWSDGAGSGIPRILSDLRALRRDSRDGGRVDVRLALA